MKRQKRILAGAAAMLLALGMLISCDTPANSGSDGGSITLPEGNPEAENKLVGTWVREGNDPDVYILNKNRTYKYGKFNEGGIVSGDEGTWSATETDLFFFIKGTGGSSTPVVLDDDDKLQIKAFGPSEFERKSGSKGSIEGIWERRYDNEITTEIIQCTIGKDSFEVSYIITSKTSSVRIESKMRGSREDNTLTQKEIEQIESRPYTLDGNTLTLDETTYKRQQ